VRLGWRRGSLGFGQWCCYWRLRRHRGDERIACGGSVLDRLDSPRLRRDFGNGAFGFGHIGGMRDIHAILFALATPTAATAAATATLLSVTCRASFLLRGSGGSPRDSLSGIGFGHRRLGARDFLGCDFRQRFAPLTAFRPFATLGPVTALATLLPLRARRRIGALLGALLHTFAAFAAIACLAAVAAVASFTWLSLSAAFARLALLFVAALRRLLRPCAGAFGACRTVAASCAATPVAVALAAAATLAGALARRLWLLQGFRRGRRSCRRRAE